VDPAMEGGSGLSEAQKAEIRRFWDVYPRAVKLHRQGQWNEAAAAYREALAVDPLHEDALYNLGNVMFELDAYEEAIGFWRRLIDVNPITARAHLQLGAIHSCGVSDTPFDLDIAEKEFQRALAINQEETGPVLKLGEVALLKGDTSRALVYLETVLQTNSKSVAANYLRGYVKWRMSDHQTALSSLRQAVAFSGVKKFGDSPSGEGDTRGGKGPMLAGSADRMSFFAPFWMALKTRDSNDVSPEQMQEEYNRLDRRLELLVGDRHDR